MSRGDGELFKDKIEVSLDGRQIFYLFFGGAVIACMVFVLGVMVGRRVEARSHVDSGAETRAALDPLAALDKLEADEREEGLVFPRALHGESREELSLGEIDESIEQGTEVVEEGEEADAETPPEEAPAPEDAPADPPEPAEKSGKPEKAEEAEKSAKPEEPEKAEKSESKYTLQLSSFQDKAEAKSFRAELRDAGYEPYLVKAKVPDRGIWYRVRLGHFPSYKAALEAKEKFERDRHIIAYVTRLPK